jgi:E3 ubiquitin-protein ligase listerin
MGKQKGRASSSGMAASLVPHTQGAVPTVGFGGYHGAVRVEPPAPSAPDAPIRLTPVCSMLSRSSFLRSIDEAFSLP